MEKIEFEKKFLALVNETNTVITAPNIAYQLEIPIEEAQEHLMTLELNGTLQQSIDNDGSSFYFMPNRPAPGALVKNEAVNSSGLYDYDPSKTPTAPIYSGPRTAPIKGTNINGMVLNAIIPGLGSLLCGHPIGIAMMLLLFSAIILIFLLPGWSKLLAILPAIAAYIWSTIAGMRLLSEKEPGPGVPQ